jgi:hypothetical protein
MASIEKMGSSFPTYIIVTDSFGVLDELVIIEKIRSMERLSLTGLVTPDNCSRRWEIIVRMDCPGVMLGERRRLLEPVFHFLTAHGAIKQKSAAKLLDAITV